MLENLFSHLIYYFVLLKNADFDIHCCIFFCLFRAAPAAYGNSQAGGHIEATAAGLYHSHSNEGSELRL